MTQEERDKFLVELDSKPRPPLNFKSKEITEEDVKLYIKVMYSGWSDYGLTQDEQNAKFRRYLDMLQLKQKSTTTTIYTLILWLYEGDSNLIGQYEMCSLDEKLVLRYAAKHYPKTAFITDDDWMVNPKNNEVYLKDWGQYGSPCKLEVKQTTEIQLHTH